ncbi:MAG: hypothetical protein IID46_16080 [Planctomycetes bacterium]|nr:hypothetical protein [Planctomycetota bacterium]
MLRINAQNLIVETFGLIQLSRTMMLNRDFQCFKVCCHKDLSPRPI